MEKTRPNLKIIFHHPRPLKADGQSGSEVRPFKIFNALKQLGIEVFPVTGSVRSRRSEMRKVKALIKQGVRFDFVYCENLTIPFAMSEPHRLPLHPVVDHAFLNFCARSGIPVSMFYRDAYWRDEVYKSMLPLWGRMITLPLYWWDWLWQTHYLDILYLPTLRMAKALPDKRGNMTLKELPPGSDTTFEYTVRPDPSEDGTLRIFYVGGIEPPTYDLSPLLEALNKTSFASLTICCRESEWRKHKHHYEKLLSDRVKTVHVSGKELIDLYANADVQAIVRHSTSYLDFAVPVKVFESISYETPIVVSPGTETARIVERHNAGWVTELEQLPELFERLAFNPQEISIKRQHLRTEKHNISWHARARQIVTDLSDL